VVGDAIGAVAVDDDKTEPRLLLLLHASHRRDDGAGARAPTFDQPVGGPVRARRVRPFDVPGIRQPLAVQPSPTMLTKQDVAAVGVPAVPALDHVEGVCKRRNPLVTGGPGPAWVSCAG